MKFIQINGQNIKLRDKAILPNEDGFCFAGIHADLTVRQNMVRKDENGFYGIENYLDIIGWISIKQLTSCMGGSSYEFNP